MEERRVHRALELSARDADADPTPQTTSLTTILQSWSLGKKQAVFFGFKIRFWRLAFWISAPRTKKWCFRFSAKF